MSVILSFLIDFIFPKLCVVCGKEGSFLCRRCKKRLPYALQVCPMCTRPNIFGLTHEKCLRKEGLSGVISVFDYKDSGVRKVIEAIKFEFNRQLIKLLLRGWQTPRKWKGCVLVPVPLHRWRKNWRGFNQAELIAKEVGRRLPIVEGLIRIRATGQQANITMRQARRENIRGAFAITEAGRKLTGKKVILVDDVFTSGATMKECAKVLIRNGASQVWGFVLAR